jgi:DNA-binding MarR family transcriptional regulator
MAIKRKKEEKILGLEGKNLVTFLLSQIGANASAKFADKLKPLGITRSHAGIIRLLTSVPGLSQRKLSLMLSVLPSRLVVLVDELVEKGFVERRDDPNDRRSYALHLTEKGQRITKSLREVSRSHAVAMTKGLTKEECNTLSKLLSKIVEVQGLTPGIHPGYKNEVTDAP